MTFDGKIVTNEAMDTILRGQPKGTLISYIEQGRFVATEDELITLFSFSMAKLSQRDEPDTFHQPSMPVQITLIVGGVVIVAVILWFVLRYSIIPSLFQ